MAIFLILAWSIEVFTPKEYYTLKISKLFALDMLKQEFGVKHVITKKYFMLIGIFLHFWGLFENVLSIKLWEHKNNKFIYKEFSINIDKSNFPEEFFNNTRNKTSKKIRLLGKINFLEVKHIINSGPKKLRDTIAH